MCDTMYILSYRGHDLEKIICVHVYIHTWPSTCKDVITGIIIIHTYNYTNMPSFYMPFSCIILLNL